MPSRVPDTKARTFNVILDTKARKQYPKALTLAEISCEAARVEYRDVNWLLGEAQRVLGESSVRLAGLRRMKGDKVLDLNMKLSELENYETLVGVSMYMFLPDLATFVSHIAQAI